MIFFGLEIKVLEAVEEVGDYSIMSSYKINRLAV